MSASGQMVDPATIKRIPVVYDKGYTISLNGLERLHPFDIKKYDRIYTDLMRTGYVTEQTTHKPKFLTQKELLLVHDADYLETLNDKQKVATYLEAPILAKIPGIKLKKDIVDPFKLASGGTLLAGRLALEHGAAVNLGGGYHHAMPRRGEGFCILADVPIAIRKLQQEGKIKKALVIDTDIHHGNGTVECLKKDDSSTYLFSMHEGGIYPWPKPQGDRDVVVPVGVTDAWYLNMLDKQLEQIFKEFKPDIVFHVSGCDALAGDPLANGGMTAEGIAKRDRIIYQQCKERGVPYVMTLSGGYSKQAWKAQSESIKGIIKKSN